MNTEKINGYVVITVDETFAVAHYGSQVVQTGTPDEVRAYCASEGKDTAALPAVTAAPESVRYAAGKTFTCTKRPFLPASDEQGPECGTEIVMHGFHWCAQVCPKCLANYFPSFGASMVMQLSHGFYPADTAALIRKNIADNGGQYIPTFR